MQSNAQPHKPGSLLPLLSQIRSSRDPGFGWSCDTLTQAEVCEMQRTSF